MPDANIVGKFLVPDANASTPWAIEIPPLLARLTNKRLMAFNLPLFDHGDVRAEAPCSCHEEDGEREEEDPGDEAEDEEVDELEDRGAEVGGQVAVLVDGVEAEVEAVG